MKTPNSTSRAGALTWEAPQSPVSRDSASFNACGHFLGRGFIAGICHLPYLSTFSPLGSTFFLSNLSFQNVQSLWKGDTPHTHAAHPEKGDRQGLRKVLGVSGGVEGQSKQTEVEEASGEEMIIGTRAAPPDSPHSRIHFSPSSRGKKGLQPRGPAAATLTCGCLHFPEPMRPPACGITQASLNSGPGIPGIFPASPTSSNCFPVI